jgi:hypothetical protein
MTLRSRIGGVLLGLSLVGVMGILPSLAQEPAKEDTAVASKAARRVPPYFAKVGATSEQKEKIYAIRAKHMVKIEALQKQIEEARAQELTECESVLLDSQKKLLEQFRAEAKSKAKSRAKATTKADTEKSGG